MLEKVNINKRNILEIITIASYILSIAIYEVFICNMERKGIYNFSLCRIVLYVIFLILLIKYIRRFSADAMDTFKTKKRVFLIYEFISIAIISYIILKWTIIYKIAIVMIAILMGAIFLTYISKNWVKNIIITICTLGMLFTVTTSFNHTLDEKKHAMSAVNLAFGNFNYTKNPLNEPAFNNIIFDCRINQYAKFFAEKYEPGLTEDWGEAKNEEMYYVSSTPADYNFMLYIPSAIGMRIAYMLGGSIADVYILGRIFNLIAYGLLVVLVLKILPSKQKIFSIVYLLPMPLLLAASYSIDGICIGLIGIFIAYCLRLEKEYEKVGIKQMAILLVLLGLCLLAKNLAYFAVAIFVLILPITKILKNNKKKLPIIITVVGCLIILCALLLVYKLNTMVINGEADVRGGDTNGKAQIEFLLENPFNIVKVCFNHMMNSILNYHWYTQLNPPEFFGEYYEQIFLLEFIFLIYVSITDESKQVNNRVKLVSILTFFAVFFSTSLMLYINFTPVRTIGINGYQTRYILPILPIVLMIVNKKNNTYKNNDILINMASGVLILIDLIFAVYKI